ncbi:MAG: hypothetical protein ACFFDN_31700 [Candidatus Hodarchaeota archaeon]
MKNNKENKLQYDLRKLGLNYHKASTLNAKHANDIIGRLQNGILMIILAEIAFIGVTDLSKDRPTIIGVIIAGALIISTFSFLFGSYAQWKHLLNTTRKYFLLSHRTAEFIKTTKLDYLNELPDFLDDKEAGFHTNKLANIFFIGSIIGVFIASILIFIRLIGLII